MDANKQLRYRVSIWAVALLLLVPGGAGVADDTALFTAVVPPNVMLMVDNSGSMNHVVWHPQFDPTQTPTCNYYNNNSNYSYSSDNSRTRCSNTRTIFVDDDIAGYTRWTGRYLNWYFSDEATPFVAEINALANGANSPCMVASGFPATYSKYRRTRITASRQVLRDVICQVNAVGEVRFGMAKFYRGSDPTGGYVAVPIADYDAIIAGNLDQAALLEDNIDSLEGEAWTPLGETLFNVYRYFQSRTQPAEGKVAGNRFKAYDIRTNGSVDFSNAPPTPVEYACQKNFVIILTDGEPTKDDFDNMDYSTFDTKLIGDYNPDNTTPEAGDEDWDDSQEQAWYLDDIAKFMQENDFQEDFAGKQVIDTYTVGFTTEGNANDILRKTADVGNGLFFKSNNAEELSAAIVTAVTDIIEKSQSFTAATVPASRATDGNNFYASFFLPSGGSAYWEGHIKNFEFNAAGEIRDALGACAVADPNAPTECVAGPLLTNAPAFWDALDVVPASANRNLFVSDYAVAPPITTPVLPPAFTRGNVAATDLVKGSDLLGVTPNAPADFPTNSASDGNELRDRIVDYVRGCEWDSSPCVERPKKLWDVFHSNPLSVGSPNAGHHEESYIAFAQKYRHRDRILYAGSNGGFLHGFRAGHWDITLDPDDFDRGTGVEAMAFMPYPSRVMVKELAKDKATPKNYGVDGSVQAADVWWGPSVSSEPSDVDQWHTVLVGNMRQGGNSLFALDVTDPPDVTYPAGRNSSLPYPGYLWEFPCEADVTKCNGTGSYKYKKYMGESWSDPVITRIKIKNGGDDNNGKGYDRWVAIVGGGYDQTSDPNVNVAYDTSSDSNTTRSGRAVFVIDIETGEPIAMKRFDHSTSQGDPRMRFAFVAQPAVFDVDFDGYADAVYFTDLGGGMWKWVIDEMATMPTTDADLTQSSWDWVKLFQADHCSNAVLGADCPEDHYRSFYFPPTGALVHGTLWLAFGTGERNNLKFPGYPNTDRENNRFYVMMDVDPLEKQLVTVSPTARYNDLPSSVDFLPLSTPDSCDYPVFPNYGYYLQAVDSEKFVTNSVIFFGTVFSLSFTPDSTADPCTSGGTSFLYGFDLFCGEGIFKEDDGNGGETRERIFEIGDGVPNRPRVSVGPVKSDDCVGTDCDPCVGANCAPPECENKVVVITSDGTAFSDSPTSKCPSGIRLNSWRDF